MRKLIPSVILVLAGAMLPFAWGATLSAQPTLTVGTQIEVQLTTTLSSSANQVGDPFTAEVEDPIFADGQEVVPAGSTLRGHVAFVKPPGRLRGKAQMRLVGDYVVTKAGKQFSFKADLADLSSEADAKKKDSEGTLQGSGKSVKKSAKNTGIATAAGAGVGAIAAGGTGAMYGAGIGVLAGVIQSLAKHHRDILLNAGTELTFQLTTAGTESKASKNTSTSAPFVCATCQ